MQTKIMVADDSQMVRQQVRSALAGAGFSVIEAHDGADALSKLDQSGVALLVLDVNMPNMNGLELLEALHKKDEYAKLAVVMLTTEGQPKLMQQAKALGAKGWIIKPFKPEQLVAVAQKLTATTAA